MNKSQLIGWCSAAALGVAVFAVPATPAAAGEAPTAPVTPVTPVAPVRPPSPMELDAQLASAQRRLEQAAQEVARLSTEVSGTVLREVMPLVGPHVIIGVQLEAAPGNVGARVRAVSPGGPAHEAGIRVGDIILALNGVELKGDAPSHQVSTILKSVKPDSPVSVQLQRDGKALALTITPRGDPGLFAVAPDMRDFNFEMPEFTEAFSHRPLRDMELATLTPRLGSYFGSDKGVLVVRAPADGALKLEDGDVILAIDGRQPTSGSHATRILSSYQSGEKVTLRIIRQHKTFDVEATLPERTHHHDHEAQRRGAALPEPADHVTARPEGFDKAHT